MDKTSLHPNDLNRLKALGDILIPGTAAMPTFSAVRDIDALLQTAAGTMNRKGADLAQAIASLPDPVRDLQDAARFAKAEPGCFDLLSSIISGAYYIAPEVLVALNYPLDRRNPAGVSDFADEYMTGIVDPVVENSRGADRL